jgi:diguanylate cyclase (GGDEF)-like protein
MDFGVLNKRCTLRRLLHPRLRAKLLMSVLVAVCAALAVQFSIAGNRVTAELTTLGHQRVTEDLTVAVNALEQMKTRMERAAGGPSVNLELAQAVRRGEAGWIRERVLEHVVENERVQYAAVMAADGDVLASVGPCLRDLGCVQAVRETAGKVVGSDIIFRDGRLWVLAAAPVFPRSNNDEPIGVLVIARLVDDAFAEALKSTLGIDLTFIVDGVVVGATDLDLAAGLAAPSSLAILGRRDGFVTSETTDSKARMLETTGAETYLVASNARAPIATTAAALRRSMLLSILPALVLAVVVAIVLSIQLGRPLRALDAAVEAMALGDLSRRVTPRGRDELTDLGHAFNAMAERVAEAQEVLHRAAVRDSLTGLLNHRELYRRLDEEVGRADRELRPLSVLMVDLDDFKGINDAFGHLRGDAVLREVARMLERCVREQDVLARYAGDEFGIVLTGTGARAALAVAERICGGTPSIAGAAMLPTSARVTVSVGVATREPGTEPVADLMERADQALYRAKEAGRDRIVEARAAVR